MTALPWKLARDPYLGPLCEKHGESAAIEAGFFFDEDATDAPLDDVDVLCTPMPKRKAESARPVVLLTTGAFCPVHEGHVTMMDRARAAATRAGFDVLGGYLSPGHDMYLELKCGPAAIPAWERLRLCADAVRGSDWLSVDPWEALHRRVSVNYTDVAARLRAYLRAHVDPDVEVLYVCGGDNARFAYAFTERGGCIVVGRPGTSAETAKWRARLHEHPRILWVDGDHPAASREIRADAWPVPSRARIVLRTEDARAVRTLGLSQDVYESFVERLVGLLSEHARVRTVALREPAAGGDAPRILSLDAMVPATHTLAISRLFALGGYEQLGHVARPGAPPLVSQVATIPAGDYVLADDDQMTGGTIAAVRVLVPPSVRIASTRLAVEHAADEDVLDARDFLLGTDDGGLVVALPHGAIGRAVYALPFVDPAVRASVRASRAFSRSLWALNASVFAGTALSVRDLPSPARAVLEAAAVSPDTALDDYCREQSAR